MFGLEMGWRALALHNGAALFVGCVLDWVFGDPRYLPHPVRLMGRMITWLEGVLRPRFVGRELTAGRILAAVMCLAWTIFPGAALALLGAWLLSLPQPAGGIILVAVESCLCYQLLAARDLCHESMKVCRSMEAGDLEAARANVSMIVGRDTQPLDGAGILRAAVETVAENASDGVIAPLIFLALGGAPLGMLYKAVNTMDSMVGYKNDRYLYFGRAAARLDDALNFLPARIAGVLMCLGGAAAGYDGKNAWRIFRRDRKRHKSPNSAHTEAACAGALQLQLAGPNYYFGQLVDKPTIGDDQRPVEALDILRAGRILYATAFFALLLFCGVPLLILLFP